jgi:hypothetical protein
VKLKGITYLLILLLATASLDDGWACATPDPFDDVLAAQDNEYLASGWQHPKGRSHEGDPPPDGFPHGVGGVPAPAPARATRQGGRPGAPSGPALLYLFMSLQR